MSQRLITIEGNIGAGKTTLVNKLAQNKNAQVILEQFADNPFLADFYKNPDATAFPLELFFLAERYKQISEQFEQGDLFQPTFISDYHFEKSLLFAQQTLKERELQLFKRIFTIIFSKLPKPDILVYLHLPVEKLLEQIAQRGRDFESNIQPEYLKKIEEQYFLFIKQKQNEIPILIVDGTEIDFVKHEEHYQLIEDLTEKTFTAGLYHINLTFLQENKLAKPS